MTIVPKTSPLFWIFGNIFDFFKCEMITKYKASKVIKMAFFDFWNQPKLILRKFRVRPECQEKLKTAKFPHCGIFTGKNPNWAAQVCSLLSNFFVSFVFKNYSWKQLLQKLTSLSVKEGNLAGKFNVKMSLFFSYWYLLRFWHLRYVSIYSNTCQATFLNGKISSNGSHFIFVFSVTKPCKD